MSRIHSVSVLYQHVIDRLVLAGIETPGIEAQVILSLALGISRVAILRGDVVEPTQQQIRELERLVSQREQRVPLAYLRGTQEFYGLDFSVTPATLIPRPETELLVDLAIRRLAERPSTFVDVGTGTGCIAVSASVKLPNTFGLALDISTDALEVAGANIKRHGVGGRLWAVRSDTLNSVRDSSIDLVLSNPPYIPTSEIEELQPEVRDYEPRLALDGGEDGFDIHRRLLAQALRVLVPGGAIGIEVAAGQAQDLARLLDDAGFSNINIHRDLAGIERVVEGELTQSR